MKSLTLKLTPQEKTFFESLKKSNLISNTIKKRIDVLLLYNEGYTAKEIEKNKNFKYRFILDSYKRWLLKDVEGLFDNNKNNKSLIKEDDYNYLFQLVTSKNNYTWEELSENLYNYNGKRIKADIIQKRFSPKEPPKAIISKNVSYIDEDNIYTNESIKITMIMSKYLKKDILLQVKEIRSKSFEDLQNPTVYYNYSEFIDADTYINKYIVSDSFTKD